MQVVKQVINQAVNQAINTVGSTINQAVSGGGRKTGKAARRARNRANRRARANGGLQQPQVTTQNANSQQRSFRRPGVRGGRRGGRGRGQANRAARRGLRNNQVMSGFEGQTANPGVLPRNAINYSVGQQPWIMVPFSETIGSVYASDVFTINKFLINPANSETAPWANQIGLAFEEFHLQNGVLEYISECNDVSTQASTGQVTLSVDYDATDQDPVSSQDQTKSGANYVFGKPSVSFSLPIVTSNFTNARYYTLAKGEILASNDDLHDYIPANMYVSVEGSPSTFNNQLIGKVQFRGTWLFKVPESNPNRGNQVLYAFLNNPTSANPLGTTKWTSGVGSFDLVTWLSATQIRINKDTAPNTILVFTLTWCASSGVVITAPVLTNPNPYKLWVSPASSQLSSYASPANGVTNNYLVMRFAYQVPRAGLANDDIISLGTAGTIPSGSQYCNIEISAYPENISTPVTLVSGHKSIQAEHDHKKLKQLCEVLLARLEKLEQKQLELDSDFE